jgi:hypothetical protein
MFKNGGTFKTREARGVDYSGIWEGYIPFKRIDYTLTNWGGYFFELLNADLTKK